MLLAISVNPMEGHVLCYRAAHVCAPGFGQAGDLTTCEVSLTDFSFHLRLPCGSFSHRDSSSLFNLVIISSLCVLLHSFKKSQDYIICLDYWGFGFFFFLMPFKLCAPRPEPHSLYPSFSLLVETRELLHTARWAGRGNVCKLLSCLEPHEDFRA